MNKANITFISILLLASAIFPVRTVAQKVLKPMELPAYLDKMTNEDLAKRQFHLAQARKKLQTEMDVFNEECAGSMEKKDKLQLIACETRNASFGNKKKSLKDSIDTFNKDLTTRTIKADLENYKKQLTVLTDYFRKARVVSPANHTVIQEGLIRGLYSGSEENEIKNGALKSPFTSQEFGKGECFDAMEPKTNTELTEGFKTNHFLATYNLNSEFGKNMVMELNGTHFKRLIAHSQGAVVAEALIRAGVISVEELDVLGGDRCLLNVKGLNELISTGKVKRILLWLNPGDVIPGTSASFFSEGESPARNTYLNTINDYLDYCSGIQGKILNNKVEFRELKGNQFHGQAMDTNHTLAGNSLSLYFNNIITYFNTPH
ncbi:MAG: hypothetical protein ACHQRM_03290 [Bacteroidia bacterium]